MDLRIDEVMKMTRLSVDTIYRLGKEGKFPMRFKIDGAHVRWHSHEIEGWIKEEICRKNQKKSTYNMNVSID